MRLNISLYVRHEGQYNRTISQLTGLKHSTLSGSSQPFANIGKGERWHRIISLQQTHHLGRLLLTLARIREIARQGKRPALSGSHAGLCMLREHFQ
jgi:hypothetical protein